MRFPGKVSDFYCFDFLLVVFGHFFLFFCVFVGLNAHLLPLVDGFLGGPGRNERRASRDIKPGDKILAVNGAEVDGAMLSELQSAASMSSPKDLDLRVQREMLDVFGPQPDEKKIDSLASLSSATWTWKPPKPGVLDGQRKGTANFLQVDRAPGRLTHAQRVMGPERIVYRYLKTRTAEEDLSRLSLTHLQPRGIREAET